MEQLQLLSMHLHRIPFSPESEILFRNVSAEIKTDLTRHDRPTEHIAPSKITKSRNSDAPFYLDALVVQSSELCMNGNPNLCV
jgi:hypothetical protein